MSLLLLFLALVSADPAALQAQLKQAQTNYDTPALEALATAMRADAAADVPTFAETLLTLAEWRRIEYEQTAAGDRPKRQALGEQIDALAQEALTRLEGAPETSEVWRMRADLRGVMMRTTAQKRKYHEEVEAAIARALELGPENPRAWATACKPHLFADPGQGQNLPKAIDLLNKALDLDPNYEAAKLLRALAHEKLGETGTARREWAEALQANPKCKPAQDKLAEANAK